MEKFPGSLSCVMFQPPAYVVISNTALDFRGFKCVLLSNSMWRWSISRVTVGRGQRPLLCSFVFHLCPVLVLTVDSVYVK